MFTMMWVERKFAILRDFFVSRLFINKRFPVTKQAGSRGLLPCIFQPRYTGTALHQITSQFDLTALVWSDDRKHYPTHYNQNCIEQPRQVRNNDDEVF